MTVWSEKSGAVIYRYIELFITISKKLIIEESYALVA